MIISQLFGKSWSCASLLNTKTLRQSEPAAYTQTPPPTPQLSERFPVNLFFRVKSSLFIKDQFFLNSMYLGLACFQKAKLNISAEF